MNKYKVGDRVLLKSIPLAKDRLLNRTVEGTIVFKDGGGYTVAAEGPYQILGEDSGDVLYDCPRDEIVHWSVWDHNIIHGSAAHYEFWREA